MSCALAAAQGATYTVQFKAAPTREEAEEEVRQLKARNISAYIVKSVVAGKGVFYRVRAGVFSNHSDAKRFGANLQQRGLIPEFFVTTYEKPLDDFTSSPAPAAPAKSKAAPRANQPDTGDNFGETRSSVKTKPENQSLKSAPSETPAPAPAATNRPTPAARTNPAARSTPASANNPGLSASVGEAPASAPPAGFARFRDPKVGYSFDYPEHWTGQALTEKEASEQRMSAGATFSSDKDSAFLNVIWNELDKANNLSNENDMIVDVILRSMSASEGISKLEEAARRVENRDGLIKTYLDLTAVLQTPEQPNPLDFLVKAVIIRASKGILLVATFYSKDAAPSVGAAVDKIIASARPPE
ncbi:MAG TPA: SPOR domain-containing protein [Blastocatellia bacterium]